MNLNLIALLVLILMTLLVLRTLTRRDKDPGSKLNLDDLLMGDDGKMSKAASVMFGAFFVTTWMVVWLTIESQMTEGYLAIYVAAWIAPTVTRLIVRPDLAAAPSERTSTTIATQTTETTK